MPEHHNFKKQYGQNFLRSHSDIMKFVEVIDPRAGDLIIEIGPGDGALTDELLNLGALVHAIEIDSELIFTLESKFADKNFKVTNQDILTVDLGELISDYQGEFTNVKIVGSLPYNISKQIIKNILQLTTRSKVSSVCFLIQKEVAQDYTSRPPKSHFLYAMSRVYGNIDYKFSADKEHFHPSPKVDGGVFKFVPYSIDSHDIDLILYNLDLTDKEKLVKFIKQGFSSPRKTVWNNLKTYTSGPGGSIKIRIGEFENAGIDPKIRAQNLEIVDWYKLYKLCTSSNSLNN